jgi:hypothetical protein
MTSTELMLAAQSGKSVTGFHSHANNRPMPAAFVASMQFRVVYNALHRMQVYTPAKKQKSPWRKSITEKEQQ